MYLSSFPDKSLDSHAAGVAMRPFSELCTAEYAADTMRGLCLALMDAQVKDRDEALAFIGGDLAATSAARGIALDEVTHDVTINEVEVT